MPIARVMTGLRDLTFKGRKIEFCDAYSAAEAKKAFGDVGRWRLGPWLH